MYSYIAAGILILGGYLYNRANESSKQIDQFKELISSNPIKNKLKENSTLLISCLYDIKTLSCATFLNKQLGYLKLMYPCTTSELKTISLGRELNSEEEYSYLFPPAFGGIANYSKQTLVGDKKFDLNFMNNNFGQDKFNHILLYNFTSAESDTGEILGQLNSIINPNSLLFILIHNSKNMSEFQKSELELHHFKQTTSYAITNNPLRIDTYEKQ